mmetsp:Transcript_35473/g.109018  ORF Transcript_35473/g.109018 Transcript_35473/m.109018 type:complete len:335 (-) Transcript_35473:12-1016(-)
MGQKPPQLQGPQRESLCEFLAALHRLSQRSHGRPPTPRQGRACVLGQGQRAQPLLEALLQARLGPGLGLHRGRLPAGGHLLPIAAGGQRRLPVAGGRRLGRGSWAPRSEAHVPRRRPAGYPGPPVPARGCGRAGRESRRLRSRRRRGTGAVGASAGRRDHTLRQGAQCGAHRRLGRLRGCFRPAAFGQVRQLRQVWQVRQLRRCAAAGVQRGAPGLAPRLCSLARRLLKAAARTLALVLAAPELPLAAALAVGPLAAQCLVLDVPAPAALLQCVQALPALRAHGLPQRPRGLDPAGLQGGGPALGREARQPRRAHGLGPPGNRHGGGLHGPAGW